MRLSDIMSNLDLSAYPQAALVLFLAAFAGIAYRALSARPDDMDRFAHIPFEQPEATEDSRHA